MVTAGANQAFSLLALALCDPGDEAVLLAPYYFSHLVALQIAQAKVIEGKWDPTTMLPDVEVGREGWREGRKEKRPDNLDGGRNEGTGEKRMEKPMSTKSRSHAHSYFPIKQN